GPGIISMLEMIPDYAAYDFGHPCSAFYDLGKFLLRHPVKRIFSAAASTDPAGNISRARGKGHPLQAAR
ncbi:MAG: hypothetical protein IJT50_13195, partial [Lentisphaeria bacterium]|nr:hypothetical protein [Lentisphaeria bacterium]